MWFNKRSRRQLGDSYELRAKQYLLEQGLRFIDSNVNYPIGELDLVFLDPQCQQYVFVEVRYRSSGQFGGAAASVTYQKQQKIKKAALFYLSQHTILPSMRFDVIAFEQEQLNWIQNAFS